MVNNWLARVGLLAVVGGLIVAGDSPAQPPQTPANKQKTQQQTQQPRNTAAQRNYYANRKAALAANNTTMANAAATAAGGYQYPAMGGLGIGGYPYPAMGGLGIGGYPYPAMGGYPSVGMGGYPYPAMGGYPQSTPVSGGLSGGTSPLLNGYARRPAGAPDKAAPPPPTPLDKPEAATHTDDDLIALKQALTSNDEDVRAKAAAGLVGKGAAAVPALTDALRTGGKDVRRLAAETLEKIGASARGATLALTKVAEKDEDETVRNAARSALAVIHGEKN